MRISKKWKFKDIMCLFVQTRQKLKEAADEKYKDFSASLLPNVKNIMGVRLPYLRKLAKEIYSCSNEEYLQYTPKYFEEKMLQGMIIGQMQIQDVSRVTDVISKFILKIDNWSLCDSFCASLKIVKSNKDFFWNFICKYECSKNEFEQRFICVLMLNYYVEEKYLDKIFRFLEGFKTEYYYSQMAAAWLICECFIKFKNETMEFLSKNKIDNLIFKKAVQKICDSKKVDKAAKNDIKSIYRLNFSIY